MIKNMQITENGVNSIHDLPIGGNTKEFGYERLWLENVQASFAVILCNF